MFNSEPLCLRSLSPVWVVSSLLSLPALMMSECLPSNTVESVFVMSDCLTLTQEREAYFLTTLFFYRYPLITHSWLFTLKHFSPLVLQLECSWLSVDSNTLTPATLSQPARAFTTSTIQWVIDDTFFRLFDLMIHSFPTFLKRMVLNYFCL